MIVDIEEFQRCNNATTVLDVTHSLQQPNQTVGVTGGRPDMIETVAKRNCSGCRWNIYRNSFDPANAKVMVLTCYI
jgi:2-dehydro-3-deoxyphosphooctonate aldolase (KDO 8-P synthase)